MAVTKNKAGEPDASAKNKAGEPDASAKKAKSLKAGYCRKCRQPVVLNDDGTCQDAGHDSQFIMGVAELPAGQTTVEKIAKFNWGAFLMPAIWGPAHGMWPMILFYPLWVFVDSCLCSAVAQGGVAIPIAILVSSGTAAFMIFFGFTAQTPAFVWCSNRGMTIEKFNKRQKRWILISALFAAVFLAGATYYNIAVRLPGMM